MKILVHEFMKELAAQKTNKEKVIQLTKEIEGKMCYWSHKEFDDILFAEFETFKERQKMKIVNYLPHGIRIKSGRMTRLTREEMFLSFPLRFFELEKMDKVIRAYRIKKMQKKNRFLFRKNLWLLEEILDELQIGLADEFKLKRWKKKLFRLDTPLEIEELMTPVFEKRTVEEMFSITKNIQKGSEKEKDLYKILEIGISDSNYRTLQRLLSLI